MEYLNLIIIFLIVFFTKNCKAGNASHPVRVCPTWSDYVIDYFGVNPKCENSYDRDLNSTQLIQKYCEATVEEYNVTTQDNYILLLQRAYIKNVSVMGSVFISHGILMNSNAWASSGKYSLACALLAQGFTVYIANLRGTIYSKTHKFLTNTDSVYWRFSFNEVGKYDFPAYIDFIYSKWNTSVVHVGFSMGTIAGLIYDITYPADATTKTLGNVLLGPAATFLNTPRSFFSLVACGWHFLEPFMEPFFHGELFSRNSAALKWRSNGLIGIFLSQLLVGTIGGIDLLQMEPSRKPITNFMNSDGISNQMLSHFAQMICTKQSCPYTGASAFTGFTNSSNTSFCYDFSKVPVPTAIIVGINDWLTEKSNAEDLYQTLSSANQQCGFSTVNFPTFNHHDFVEAKDSYSLVYQIVIDRIFAIINGTCNNN